MRYKLSTIVAFTVFAACALAICRYAFLSYVARHNAIGVLREAGILVTFDDFEMQIHAEDHSLSDESIESLNVLSSEIKVLALSGSRVDDSSVLKIARMPAVRELELRCPNVTGIGIAHMCTVVCPQVVSLDLSDSGISDGDVNQVARCPNLLVLRVARTGLSGQCCESLRSIRSLEFLDRRETGVPIDCVHSRDTRVD